jgi:hypothetical protein
MMKKLIAAALFILILASSVFAESGTLQCDKGECEGWEAIYEGYGNKYQFLFKNVSGKAAFNIKVLINTFDYFGEYLGRLEFKLEGPIYERIPYKATVHPKTSKITYDIYWSDRSGKPADTIQGAE